jgi:putative ABC transport system permease protein
VFNELWSEARCRLRRVFRRAEVDREIDDEMAFHIEREADKLRRAGLSREDAQRNARIAFGGVTGIKDDTRDAHGTALLEQLLQDIAYAIRGLRARPLFTAVVVATLGLGVGVNAAMFSVLDRALFRPPPYLRDAAAVHRVFVSWKRNDDRRQPGRSLEYLRYQDFSRATRLTSQVGAFGARMLAIGEGDDAHEVLVATMSANVFGFFDATPVIGRFFAAADDAMPAGSPVAVISYDFWNSRFGARRDILGAALRIDKETYTVIGVAPRGFRAFSDDRVPAAFIPVTHFAFTIDPGYAKDYGWSWLNIFVRSKNGVTDAEATADLTNAYRVSWNAERALGPGLATIEKAQPEAIAAPVQLARGPTAGADVKVMKWVSGVAFIVLMVACANVANLLLARALRRRREIAVRRALGGSRGRIVRQLLTETAVLSTLGGLAGLVAAQLTSNVFAKLFAPSSEPGVIAGDGRTIVFALAVTLLSALLAGLMPALHAGHEDLADSLRGGMREGTYRHARVRTTLLVFQTMFSVVLLVGAGLFMRSLNAVRALRLGYDVEPLVVAKYAPRGVKLTSLEMSALGDRLVAEARAIPGIVDATLTISIPFNSSEGRAIYVAGVDSIRKLGQFELQAGSPEYFSTTGTRILRGRGITADDRADGPRVVVVSEAMGKVLWKGADPIGKCIRIGRDTMPCTTVVGIAENTRTRGLTGESEFAYYMPIAQYQVVFGATTPTLYVRVHDRADDYAETIRARLQRVVPGPGYVMTTPFHTLVDPTRQSWESGATMFMAFGGLALALAAIGLYAVIAFSVSQRTQELGVRIALGALPGDVLRLVVGEGARVTLVGVAIGIGIALMASRAIAPLLFGVSARDPIVYATVAVVLVGVGIVACLIPASRAARVDPNTALRVE